jgi:hypothetical protein
MAGIGIAAAIGFVFVLSFMVNKGVVDESGSLLRESMPGVDQQRTTMPEEPGAQPFAKDSGESAPAGGAAMSTMAIQASPFLSSLTTLDANRDVISEVAPGTEFRAHDTAVIRASITNPGDAVASDHFIALSVRPAGAGEVLTLQDRSAENAAILQGNIAANSTVNLELYWTPQTSGDYNILVFSATPDELASTEQILPAASVPVKVSK